MKPEEQRIAIAEACGWTPADDNQIKERAGTAAWMLSKGPWWRNENERTVSTFDNLPDYLNDLNAMHDAEKRLLATQFKRYHDVLVARVIGWSAHENEHVAIHATAAQRAEAFLRTIGKWVSE